MAEEVQIAPGPINKTKWMVIDKENPSGVRIVLILLRFLLYNVVTIGMWGHLFYCIGKYRTGEWTFSFDAIGDDCTGIMSSHFGFYFQLVYISRSKDMKRVAVQAGVFDGYERPDDFVKWMKLLNKCWDYLRYFLYASLVLTLAFTLAQKCEDGVVGDCGLLITAYMPFDLFRTPARQIFCTLQYVGAFNSAIDTACICLPILTANYSLVLQTKHLQVMLLRIPKAKGRRERRGLVKQCVLYHYRILDHTADIITTAEPFYFTLVFWASIIISMTSYQFLAIETKFVTLIHTLIYLLCSGIACGFGELLINEGENLYNTIYDAMPLDGDTVTCKDLYIMMATAANGISIQAGKFGPVGHLRYMMMLKGTYSFLSLFLNVE